MNKNYKKQKASVTYYCYCPVFVRPSACLSVCLSDCVTRRYCIKTNEPIVKQPVIELATRSYLILKTLVNHITWDMNNLRFSTNVSLYLGNDTR